MRRFIVAWSDHGCLTALAWVKWLKAKVIHQAQDGTADESREGCRASPGMQDARADQALAE